MELLGDLTVNVVFRLADLLLESTVEIWVGLEAQSSVAYAVDLYFAAFRGS